MNLVVIGGKLQGLEICYLAKKANWRIILIDRNSNCISKLFADSFYCIDVLSSQEDCLSDILSKGDFVIPAIEDIKVLERVNKLCRKYKINFIFDNDAYHISASKKLSNDLFRKLELNIPAVFPDGDGPYIIKPVDSSGSQGVEYFDSKVQVANYLALTENEMIVQEFIAGPSYSIEVIGDGENFLPYLVTEIITDECYDCCQVVVESEKAKQLDQKMFDIGYKIGKALAIKGIFDVETILGKDGKMYLLEIDARFPSQTPIAVFHATGINLLKQVCEKNNLLLDRSAILDQVRHVDYQNIHVIKRADEQGKPYLEITRPGEHDIGLAGNMSIMTDFFGVAEAITDYYKGTDEFRAILIFVQGYDSHTIKAQYSNFLENLKEEMISYEE